MIDHKKLDELCATLKQAVVLIDALLSEGDHCEQVNELLQDFGKNLCHESAANVFWSLLGDADQMSSVDKITALNLAEAFGPDYVSKLRRMGKFMAESQNA